MKEEKKKEEMNKEQIIEHLTAEGEKQMELHKKASAIRDENVSKNVYFRGLIEFSNICRNDCYYCGIKKSNNKVKRYFMHREEILSAVESCDSANYCSVVLQSGERSDSEFINLVIETIREIKNKFPKMCITLCVGEQTKELYKKFFDAGAHRYLLRIETSDEEHYKKLHPREMSFKKRKKCLENLREIGFHVGTGVMIGSPFQTIENLADDLLFFKEIDADMIGMGPFIPYEEAVINTVEYDRLRNLNLSLNMIACLRILIPDINIAATTALQALHPKGRELGLNAGANVIMPLATPEKYRKNYQLYNNKPCLNESSDDCLKSIVDGIESVGLSPKFGESGDSLHYLKRVEFKEDSK